MMDEMYGLPPDPSFTAAEDLHRLISAAGYGVAATAAAEPDIKSRISSHPRYPHLLQAYIDCQKVGAPPDVASLLDEIRRVNGGAAPASLVFGADPELDEFMEMYCEVLVKYRRDLSQPFEEAAAFLNAMEVQLSDLCKPVSRPPPSLGRFASDEAVGSSEEELSGGEVEVPESHSKDEERELKETLLRKYSGYLSSLKKEFSKKKKKGKLPREARQVLLDWWTAHYKWPYPTEADKISLAETTGLDQKQINNWFINQRKRHWKPSENMQFTIMDGFPASSLFADD